MDLSNEYCSIQIKTDPTYTLQSTDNKYYDLVINPDNYSKNEFYKAFSIHINLFNDEYTIALVGDGQSNDFDCAFLDDYILTIMQNCSISQIDVRSAKLLLHKEIDCYGCAFAIYRVQNGYIVYGEIEIICLDNDFNKLWGFSGRDIFASISGKKPFELCENCIKLFDFEDNYYELDFDGNLLTDIPTK